MDLMTEMTSSSSRWEVHWDRRNMCVSPEEREGAGLQCECPRSFVEYRQPTLQKDWAAEYPFTTNQHDLRATPSTWMTNNWGLSNALKNKTSCDLTYWTSPVSFQEKASLKTDARSYLNSFPNERWDEYVEDQPYNEPGKKGQSTHTHADRCNVLITLC